jgi:hypothetical protein
MTDDVRARKVEEDLCRSPHLAFDLDIQGGRKTAGIRRIPASNMGERNYFDMHFLDHDKPLIQVVIRTSSSCRSMSQIVGTKDHEV